MKIELSSHPGVIFEDPVITRVETIDRHAEEAFIPTVLLHGENYDVLHVLPPQPYVNGTWVDEDVDNAIAAYFQSISE